VALARSAAQGVPELFWPQRFGYAGGNVAGCAYLAERGALPPARGYAAPDCSPQRVSLVLFKWVLGSRVADGSWNTVLAGRLSGLYHSRSQVLC